jgi:PPE-repeat protein
MDFALLPPEVNSARIYAGPGSGPMLAGAAGWAGLASDLESSAAAYESVVSGVTDGPWLGPSSASMAAAAMPYVTWLRTTAAQAAQAATQARRAAGAYEEAFAMTVPPPVIATNRNLLMSLTATNFLGQNAAAIAATEAQYVDMWAQDAAAMYGYAVQSAAASALTPFSPAPETTNTAGVASQSAAVTQAVATSAGTGAQTIASMGPQLLSALPAALQGLAQPSEAMSEFSGILEALGFTSAQSFLSLFGFVSPYTATMATVNLCVGLSRVEDEENEGLAGSLLASEVASAPGELTWASPAGIGGSAVTAGLGKGSAIEGLSTPPAWAVAAPEFRTVARALPIGTADAPPAVVTGTPGTLFSEMGLAGMARRAMGGTAGLGGQQGAVADSRQRVGPPQRVLRGLIVSIADELQKLAELHTASVLTDAEFDKLKRRLLAR